MVQEYNFPKKYLRKFGLQSHGSVWGRGGGGGADQPGACSMKLY